MSTTSVKPNFIVFNTPKIYAQLWVDYYSDIKSNNVISLSRFI